jgi:hypothetical protein
VHEDDDYNWDRYQTDSDYANGVDDTMDEIGRRQTVQLNKKLRLPIPKMGFAP